MRRIWIALSTLACPWGALAQPTTALPWTPVPVSPGGEEEMVRVEGRCPTFSWGFAGEAMSFELVIVGVSPQADATPFDPWTDDAAAEHRTEVPGSALSWTPQGEECLEAGGSYAWSLRAVTAESASDWSPPLLLEVALPWEEEELARIVEERLEELLAGERLASLHRSSRPGDASGSFPTLPGTSRKEPPTQPTGHDQLLAEPAMMAVHSSDEAQPHALRGFSESTSFDFPWDTVGVMGIGVSGGLGGASGTGVLGWGSFVGVRGEIDVGGFAAVEGQSFGEFGGWGVYGESKGSDGVGVRGHGKESEGGGMGVWGSTWAIDGRGLYGEARSADAAATSVGVLGTTSSPLGFGGFFVNEGGGDLLAAGTSEDGPSLFRVTPTGGLFAEDQIETSAGLLSHGTVESTSGGFVFPDGSVQTEAFVGPQTTWVECEHGYCDGTFPRDGDCDCGSSGGTGVILDKLVGDCTVSAGGDSCFAVTLDCGVQLAEGACCVCAPAP